MRWLSKLTLQLLVLVAGLAVLPTSQAQTGFPAKPVRFIVPFPPGGSGDTFARVLARQLQEMWGQPVLAENKPGAGTMIGTDFVAKSVPDGHTLGLVIPAHATNPTLQKSMPFDTLKDLAGVTQLSTIPIALFATLETPANTIEELIAYAKKNPGKLTYGSVGIGSSSHLAGALLNSMAGIDLVHVPYKGSSAAGNDLLGGRLALLFDAVPSQIQFVRSGKIKMIAAAGAERIPALAQYKTIAETVPGFSIESYYGVVVPSATSRELVRSISRDFARAMHAPGVKERMEQLMLVPVASTPEQFDGFIRAEILKWEKVIKAIGATAE